MDDAGQHGKASGIAKILPNWYMDLNSDKKPLVGALLVLLGVVPMMILGWHESKVAEAEQDTLNALLASGTATKAQIQASADAMAHAIMITRISLVAGVGWGLMIPPINSYLSGTLASEWLKNLATFADRVAEGDLSTTIERNNNSQIGDIQEALGKLAGSFRVTIERIELAASELRSAASEMVQTSDQAGNAIGEVAQSISSISEGAAHQVDLVTRTSGVVGEIENSVRETAAHAEQAKTRSADTEALTEEGVNRAAEVQEAMQSVRETSLATAEMIRSLGDKSTNIDQIIHSITDIAAQTNLLALNAAIEAARAGEQGRGFAVVAEEVRKLAEDAQDSAGDIAKLIGEVREQTAEAVTAMESGVQIVESGFETVNRNRQTFNDISAAVRALHASSAEVSALAGGIADSASDVRGQIEEVASVAEESSASTEQVSASTEETSAASEEVTASAQRVAHTAFQLASLAGHFDLRSGTKRVVVTAGEDPAAQTAAPSDAAEHVERAA
ncbi:MAG: methyl-accepting chemotaxis protein [Solirubrobacterales bacterium]